MKDKRSPAKFTALSLAHAREAFGRIKVNLDFLGLEQSRRCVIVSSSVPGEGKSMVTANLGISLAASERRVLIVDADLRHPTQHRLFEMVNRMGLSDIIAGNLNWRDYTSRTGTPGLHVITAGRQPPNPAELLGSRRMGELVEAFRREYDIVLFDSAPVLLLPDAAALSRHADGFIIVARQGVATQPALLSLKEALRLAGKPIIGTILNNVPKADDRYGYGYGYGGARQADAQPSEKPLHT